MYTISGDRTPLIGSGLLGSENGTLNLPDHYRVFPVGSDPVPVAERKSFLRGYRDGIEVIIEACTHEPFVYTVTDEAHTTVAGCAFCLSNPEAVTQPHDFDTETHVCTACGYAYEGALYTVSFDANHDTGSMAPVQVVPGHKYLLPENGFVAPDGMCFTAWMAIAAAGNQSDPLAEGAECTVSQSVLLQAPWQVVLPFGVPFFSCPKT